MSNVHNTRGQRSMRLQFQANHSDVSFPSGCSEEFWLQKPTSMSNPLDMAGFIWVALTVLVIVTRKF